MKKSLVLLILLTTFLLSKGQVKFQIGSKVPNRPVQSMNEHYFDSTIYLGIRPDTNFIPNKMGAIIVRSVDKNLYYWSGVKWTNISSGGGSSLSRFGIEDNVGVQNRAISLKDKNFSIRAGDDSNYIKNEAEFYLDENSINISRHEIGDSLNGYNIPGYDNSYNMGSGRLGLSIDEGNNLGGASVTLYHSAGFCKACIPFYQISSYDSLNNSTNIFGINKYLELTSKNSSLGGMQIVLQDTSFSIARINRNGGAFAKLSLPKNFNNGVFPLSVNGNLPDSNGNIKIPKDIVYNLQQVTDQGSSTTNDLVSIGNFKSVGIHLDTLNSILLKTEQVRSDRKLFLEFNNNSTVSKLYGSGTPSSFFLPSKPVNSNYTLATLDDISTATDTSFLRRDINTNTSQSIANAAAIQQKADSAINDAGYLSIRKGNQFYRQFLLPTGVGGGGGGTTYTGTAPVVVTGSVISVNDASQTTSGVINTVAQMFAGQKQFNNDLVVKSVTGIGQYLETNNSTFGTPSLRFVDLGSGVNGVITPRSGDFVIGTVTPHPIIFVTNSQPRMTFGTDGDVAINKASRIFNTVTPGTGIDYGIHLAGSNTNDYAKGITWDAPSTLLGQAGIYVQGSGSYGTKMYFGTTDSYGAGVKTAMSIDQSGNVNLLRGNLYVASLSTSLTPPLTTGTTKMVTVDQFGMFSSLPLPTGGGTATDTSFLRRDINLNTSAIAGKVNIADTSAMLNTYKTAINTKLNITDTANIRLRPIAGTNTTITGTYPNLTFNSTATGGTGIVNTIGVTTANGVSATSSGGADPRLTVSLGAITPSTIVATGAVSGTNLSGTNTGDNATNSQYSGLVSNATHTGDVTGATALTLATVNTNVGTFTNANVTVNAKGLITSVANGSAGGTGSTVTANNGLTKTGDNIQFGGSLTNSTTLLANGGTVLNISGSKNGYDSSLFSVINNGQANAISGQTNSIYSAAILGKTTGSNSVGVAGIATSADGVGVQGRANGATGIAGQFYSQAGIALQGGMNSGTAGVVETILELYKGAASPTAGTGLSIDLKTSTSTSTRITNQLISKWLDATDATRTSEFSIIGANNSTTNVLLKISGAGVFTLTQGLTDYVDDTAAAAGGIPINGLYRTGSSVKIRVI